MISIGTYLLQMNCWMAAFWLVYYFSLKRETFFNINRWFLNIGLIISMITPLIPIHYLVIIESIKPIYIPPSSPIHSEVPISRDLPPVNYWILFYGAGILFSVLITISKHVKLLILRKKSTVAEIHNLRVHKIESQDAPFSFFNHIYVSSNISSTEEINTIVAHEKVHITERHWVDLLLFEVARTLQWFNPLILIYRRAMMQNHEFLADSGTIQQGVSIRTYRAVLANQMLGVSVVQFANSFTFRNSQNRITMMSQNKSSKKNIYKVLFILPFISIIMMGFAKPKNVYQDSSMEVTTSAKKITAVGTVSNEKGDPLCGVCIVVKGTKRGTITDKKGAYVLKDIENDATLSFLFIAHETLEIQVKKQMNVVLTKSESSDLKSSKDSDSFKKFDTYMSKKEKAYKPTIINGEKVYVVVNEMPTYPGGMGKLEEKIAKEAAKLDLGGYAYVSFIVDTDGSIYQVSALNSSDKSLNKPAEDIIKNVTEYFNPGKQDGEPVKVNYCVKVEF